MAIPDPQLINVIGMAIRSATDESGDWTRSTLQVSAMTSTIETTLEIERPDGTKDRSRGVATEARVASDDLRENMYADGLGTWYNATFTLTPNGELTSYFDYDNPPLNGEFTRDMIEDDFDVYPRSPENVPDWLRDNLERS